MVKINLVEDVLFPGVVPLVDWVVSDKIPASAPGKYANYTGLGMCLAGYGLSAFGIGGRKSLNIGIASLDWAVSAIKNLVKGATAPTRVFEQASQRLVMRPASRVATNPMMTHVAASRPVGLYVEEAEILS